MLVVIVEIGHCTDSSSGISTAKSYFLVRLSELDSQKISALCNKLNLIDMFIATNVNFYSKNFGIRK